MSDQQSINQKCQSIRLLLSDVDGVLTNGKLIYSSSGMETKEFHVRDGLAVKLWKTSGYPFGLITARQSPAVQQRSEELGVDFLYQSRPHKLDVINELASREHFDLSEIAYVGDDLHDLSAIRAVGLGITVQDAVDEVKSAADLVTARKGGEGALREVVECLLKSQGKWNQLIDSFSGKSTA